MSIDPSQSTTPFASVNDVSYFKDKEDEVLFSMHNVFRIGDITPMGENQRLFRVELTLTSDNDQDLCLLTDHIQKETYPEAEGWYRLGKLLLRMDQPKKAEQVYNILLEQNISERKTNYIYHQLGWTKWTEGEHKEAITFYEKAIEIYKKILPPNHPDMAPSYNDIGLVYYNMGEYSKALSHYEKALEIQQQSLSLDHPDLGLSYNNIGTLYEKMGSYSKTRSFYERAVDITQRSLPLNHPDVQGCRTNLDRVKYKL